MEDRDRMIEWFVFNFMLVLIRTKESRLSLLGGSAMLLLHVLTEKESWKSLKFLTNSHHQEMRSDPDFFQVYIH